MHRRTGEMYFWVDEDEEIQPCPACPQCDVFGYHYFIDRYVVDRNTGYRRYSTHEWFRHGEAWCVERECRNCGKCWSEYELV